MTAYQIEQVIGISLVSLLIGLLFSRFIYPQKDSSRSKKTAVTVLVTEVHLASICGTSCCPYWHKDIASPQLINKHQNVDEILQTVPFYQTIKEQKPEIYKKVVNAIITHTENPEKNSVEMLQQGQILLAPILLERLSQTSNQALIAYTADMTSVLSKLYQHDPELCYFYLFPDPGQSTPVSSKKRQLVMNVGARIMNSMNRVLLDYNSSRSVPSETQVEKTIIEVSNYLYDHHGSDVELLDNPEHVHTPARRMQYAQ